MFFSLNEPVKILKNNNKAPLEQQQWWNDSILNQKGGRGAQDFERMANDISITNERIKNAKFKQFCY